MTRRLLIFSWVALVASGCPAPTTQVVPDDPPPPTPVEQDEPPAEQTDPSLAEKLPIDPAIRVGTLDNGLTYYIRPHKKPAQRALLWLGVDAGSVLEDDDQLGLAHFVEHMAFNGTKRFEKQAIVNYLEQIGMKFGPDVNAYTSFDQTVYQLQLPTDDPAIISKGFEILEDWAQAVTFDPAEVDKERGVVLEEWRLGRGARKRIVDKQYPVLFKGSRYAERLPIGQAEIIQNAPVAALTRFYRDWYRPDLMAVVAVGDFDPDAIEAHIKQHFAGLRNPERPRDRPDIPVPGHRDTLISIESDPEMPRTSVRVLHKLSARPDGTAGDYRRFIAEQLYHSMLSARLGEIRQRPDAPFLSAYSTTQSVGRAADAIVQGASVKQGAIEAALNVLVTEVARVEQHGFTATEFDRAKKQMVRGYQRSVRERDKVNPRRYAAEILRHHFDGEAELALVERFLPDLTLDELNSLSRKWMDQSSRVVLVSGPDTVKMPGRSALLAMLTSVDQRALKPYQDNAPTEPLLADKPTPGTIVKTRTIDDLGVTVWTLSNGIRVVVKPTDFRNDQVLLTAFSPGGHSRVSDEDYPSGRFASSIAREAGVGAFSAIELRKALAGKVAWARAWIGELEEGVSAGASPDDLETMLQLVYLRVTAPRKHVESFHTWRARSEEGARNRRLSPERAFSEDMRLLLSQGHARRQPVTVESLARVDVDRALAIYRDRFADVGDFTVILVGNLDLTVLQPLVATYLGGLPATKRKESWKDIGVRRPNGVKTLELKQGTEPKSRVRLTFHGPARWSRDAENNLTMLREVLRIRLREVLREDMGGVYGVSVSGGIARRPKQRYSVTISFGCAPDNVAKLKAAVFQEIRTIKKSGIGADYIAKIKQARIRRHETDLKSNRFWQRALTRAYRYKTDPRLILDHRRMVDRVSSRRVRAAARKYLNKKRYAFGVLKPEIFQ